MPSILYSLFQANLDERKRCHFALRPDKSILKEVPGSKYAPILSCKIPWGWDENSALHNNWKLMSIFWMGNGTIITSDYSSRQWKIIIMLKSKMRWNEVQRHGRLFNKSCRRNKQISINIFLCDGSWLHQPPQNAWMHQKFEIPNRFDFLAKRDFLIKMWMDYSSTSVNQCFLKNLMNYDKVLLGMARMGRMGLMHVRLQSRNNFLRQ